MAIRIKGDIHYKLKNSESVFKNLINLLKNTGNDIFMDDKENIRSFRLSEDVVNILNNNGTILPMPIIFSYLPAQYFRMACRLIQLTLDPKTLSSGKSKPVLASDLYNTLPIYDKIRFFETASFLLKMRFIVFGKVDTPEKMTVSLCEPYKSHYCAVSISAMTAISKSYLADNPDFLELKKYPWSTTTRKSPVIPLNFDKLNK